MHICTYALLRYSEIFSNVKKCGGYIIIYKEVFRDRIKEILRSKK